MRCNTKTVKEVPAIIGYSGDPCILQAQMTTFMSRKHNKTMRFDVPPGDYGNNCFKGSGDVYAGSFKKTGKTLIKLNRGVYGAILLKAKRESGATSVPILWSSNNYRLQTGRGP